MSFKLFCLQVLSGNVSQADWDRLQYYSRKVKFFETKFHIDQPQIHPSTYVRIAQLQSSALFPSLRHLQCSLDDRSISHIFLFLSPVLDSLEFTNIRGFENTIVGPFLATLSSPILRRIVLRSGWMSVDILKNSIVHFKQLQSLELRHAVFMSDFVSSLMEVIGTLPSLENLTLMTIDPEPHPAHAPENSNSQSRGPKYFGALERLRVMGTFFFIQHLLGFIDSPHLETIKVKPITNFVRDEHEDLFAPIMTRITSKWSRSLKTLVISSCPSGTRVAHRNAFSKCLILLGDLQEMEAFCLIDWRIEDVDDYVRCLVLWWPKIRTLYLNETRISLSTLRIIAENCPELRYLHIRLDTSSIPSFDTSSERLHHKLEVLVVEKIHPSQTTLKHQIQVTRLVDLIFPYLKSIEVCDETWPELWDLVKLCQDVRRTK